MTASTAHPRALAADLLRGVALFGILVVNLPFLANTIYVDAAAWTGADAMAQFVVRLLFEAKFYILFAALFGYGFHGLHTAAVRAATSSGWRYARRLTGLLGFGVLHATCLFVGDILVSYAALGAALWWVRDWSDRRLVRAALAMLGVALVGRGLLGVGVALDPTTPTDVAAMHATATAAYRGTFTTALAQRLDDLIAFYIFTPLFNWPTMIAAFLLGYLGARRRMLARPGAYWRRHRRALPWLAIEAMSAPALSAVYLLLTCRLAHQYGDHPLVQRVAGAGRMSLTMYLGQGAVANALFMGWGLGWFGRLGPMALLALAPVLYTVLVWLAARWQSHFRLGPDEWLLRSLTYWRWEAMRRATS